VRGNEAKVEAQVGVAQVVAALRRQFALGNGGRRVGDRQAQVLKAAKIGAGVLLGQRVQDPVQVGQLLLAIHEARRLVATALG